MTIETDQRAALKRSRRSQDTKPAYLRNENCIEGNFCQKKMVTRRIIFWKSRYWTWRGFKNLNRPVSIFNWRNFTSMQFSSGKWKNTYSMWHTVYECISKKILGSSIKKHCKQFNPFFFDNFYQLLVYQICCNFRLASVWLKIISRPDLFLIKMFNVNGPICFLNVAFYASTRFIAVRETLTWIKCIIENHGKNLIQKLNKPAKFRLISVKISKHT